MSKERIDLTQEELKRKLFDWMTKDYNQNQFIDTRDEWYSIDEIMDGIEHLGLLAELKRCYEEIDFLKENVIEEDELCWIATCKPDGEGRCQMTIEGYEELMRLEKEGKIEIPEYSHGDHELLLEEGCECGITHDEWLESKN